MSSSAPNTQGQITVAKLAKGVGARIVDADIAALEAGYAIGCLDALPTPWATLRPSARGLDGRSNLGLGQRAHRPGVDLHVKAGGIDLHQRPCVSDIAGDGSKCPAARWDGVAVEPPRAAQGDGEAATIVVGHGRHLLGVIAGVAHREEGIVTATGCGFAGKLVGLVGAQDFALLMRAGGVLENNGVRAAGLGDFRCGLREGHFQLPPLISRGAEGKQSASHDLNYTHETKERKNFLHLFFGWRGHQAKPSNAELRPQAGQFPPVEP